MVVTDGLSSYHFLDANYDHVVVEHTKGEYKKGRFHTNGIENFWSLLSRAIIGIYHHVSPKHLAADCNEFSCRYNTRKINDRERFDAVVKRVGNARITYNTLIGKEELKFRPAETLAKKAPISGTGFEFLDEIDLDSIPEAIKGAVSKGQLFFFFRKWICRLVYPQNSCRSIVVLWANIAGCSWRLYTHEAGFQNLRTDTRHAPAAFP